MTTLFATENPFTAYATALGCENIRDERDAAKRVNSCLAALGCVRDCPRCGGSGHFSRNSYGSTTCYTCDGRGRVVVKITAKEVAEAAKRVAAGALDGWRAANRARAEAKRAILPACDAFDAAQKACPIGRECDAAYNAKYNGRITARVSAQVEFPEDLHRAQIMVNSLSTAVHEARNFGLYRVSPEDAKATAEWAIGALAEVAATWAQYKGDRDAAALAHETAATVTEW